MPKPELKRFLALLSILSLNTLPVQAVANEAALDYTIFDTCPLPGAYLYSSTESTGDSWVENLSGKLPVRTEPAYTPGSSLQVKYVSNKSGTWEARILHRLIRGQDDWDNGVFTQEKPTPFKKPEVLQMKLLNSETNKAALPAVSLILADKKLSAPVSMGNYLSKDDGIWSTVRIPITEFKNASITSAEQVKGIALGQAEADGVEHSIFLDQIEIRPAVVASMDPTITPSISSTAGFERHVDISWAPISKDGVAGTIVERSSDGKNFEAVGFRPKTTNRYSDYVGENFGTYRYRIRCLGYDGKLSNYSNITSATTHAMTDDAILDMVQEACGRYYWDGGEAFSGMTLESIPGDAHMVAIGASGFGIMSLLVSAHRNHVPRAQVCERLTKILNFLERADRFHGVFAHYYNGQTGHPILFFGPDDNGGDLVETSFLMQGLLMARQFFDGTDAKETEVRARIIKLWESVEWDWHRKTPPGPYLVWHWSPTVGFKIDHRLIGWNESMITYLLAVASPTHGVPPEMYYSGWASQERSAQQYRGDGAGKMYTNGETYHGTKLPVGGFTGGPIFFTHYNFMGMDPHNLKDKYTDYFDNSKAIAKINLRYCQNNPEHHAGYGDTGWGLTASDGPWSYNPDEPRKDGDKDKLTPTGAVASMPYLPAESIAALKNYYRNCGSFLWGEYGFRDAYSPDQHWVNDLYMGLNQAPMVVMIENYRTGAPWKWFGSNAEIQNMRKRVFENTQSTTSK